jgi:hypothetical protein
MRCIRRCFAALLLVVLWPFAERPSAMPITWVALSPDAEPGPSSPTAADRLLPPAEADRSAIEEMLRGSKGRLEQWTDVPELVVLTTVMEFETGGSSEYVATSEGLTAEAVDDLVTELTSALGVLTGGAFDQFAAIRHESIAPGASTRVIRKNQIVVGRYRNVRNTAGVLGLGGRAVRSDGSITGAALVLDDEYDRSGPMRALLRAHELGHALGYHHVESRQSIMNPRIGPGATDLDRRIATIAYRGNGQHR